jgi:TRAP-type C4-dicarboxylate transport system substrate-binding protein
MHNAGKSYCRGEQTMKRMSSLSRRQILAATLAAPAVIAGGRLGFAAEAKTLKISHQFPGGTVDSGDFRDRLARKFAAEVEKRTGGSLKFEIYPDSSLMKTIPQFSAVRKGALDLSVYPLAYAGGEVPEVNIGLMPCLVTSYAQGLAWKKAQIGEELEATLEKKGVMILTWVWQAGGVASRAGAIVDTADVTGLKVRGGSREMDLMLKEAGGIISSVPSNEIYPAMQTGSLDAAVTSSTSLISFRLEEISKNVTSGKSGSFWFMLEPLIMSKAIFDGLAPDEQKAIRAVGTELEAFALEAAKADDDQLAAVYSKAGVKVSEFTAPALDKWRGIAEATAWKDFAARNEDCARLLKMAQTVTA